jgi:hypothetical protein
MMPKSITLPYLTRNETARARCLKLSMLLALLALFQGCSGCSRKKEKEVIFRPGPDVPAFDYALTVVGFKQGSSINIECEGGGVYTLNSSPKKLGEEIPITDTPVRTTQKTLNFKLTLLSDDSPGSSAKPIVTTVSCEIEKIKNQSFEFGDDGKYWKQEILDTKIDETPLKIYVYICELKNATTENIKRPEWLAPPKDAVGFGIPTSSGVTVTDMGFKEDLVLEREKSNSTEPFSDRSSFLTYVRDRQNSDVKPEQTYDLIETSAFDTAMQSSQLIITDNGVAQKLRVAVQNTLISDKIVLTDARYRYPLEILDGDQLLRDRKPVPLATKLSSGNRVLKEAHLTAVGATKNELGTSAITDLSSFQEAVNTTKESQTKSPGINHSTDIFTCLSESQFSSRIGGNISVSGITLGASMGDSGSNRRTTVAVVFRQVFFSFKRPGELSVESLVNPDLTTNDFKELLANWKSKDGQIANPCVVDSVDFGTVAILIVEADATAEQMVKGITAGIQSTRGSAGFGANWADASWLNTASIRLFTWGVSPTVFNDANFQWQGVPQLQAPIVSGEQNADGSTKSEYIFPTNENPPIAEVLQRCFTVRPTTEESWKYCEAIGYSCTNLANSQPFYVASVGPADYEVAVNKEVQIEVEIRDFTISDDGDQFLFWDRDGDWHFVCVGPAGIIKTSGLQRFETTLGTATTVMGFKDRVSPFLHNAEVGKKQFNIKVILGESDGGKHGVEDSFPPDHTHLELPKRWDDNVSVVKDFTVDLDTIFNQGTPLNANRLSDDSLTKITNLMRDPRTLIAAEHDMLTKRLAALDRADKALVTGVAEIKKSIERKLSQFDKEAVEKGQASLNSVRHIQVANPGLSAPSFYEHIVGTMSNGKTSATVVVRLVVPSERVDSTLLKPPSQSIPQQP